MTSTGVELTAEQLAKVLALLELLTDGPRFKSDIMQAAQARGFSEAPIRRARENLNIYSKPEEFGGKFKWGLPGDDNRNC